MNDWALKPDHLLSNEELSNLLKRAEDLRVLGVHTNRKQPVRDWLIIKLSLLSGLRASEICAMQVTDCFIGYGRSEIVVRRGKGGRTRVVRIGTELKRDLRWFLKWKHEQGELHADAYVLCSKRSPRMSRAALWRRWKRYCPVHRLQDARHTHAALLYEASQDLRLVQKQLGHSRPSISRIFAGVAGSTMKEALDSMERLARGGVKGSPRKAGSMHPPAGTDNSVSIGGQARSVSAIPPGSTVRVRSVANPMESVAKDVSEKQELLRIQGP